jgi:hypothetical protein
MPQETFSIKQLLVEVDISPCVGASVSRLSKFHLCTDSHMIVCTEHADKKDLEKLKEQLEEVIELIDERLQP